MTMMKIIKKGTGSVGYFQEAVVRRCSVKGVLRNFAKFTGKHMCQSLFLNKFAGFRPAFLLKKRLWNRCFPFAKFLRTPFIIGHLWWLLLIFFNLQYKYAEMPKFPLSKSMFLFLLLPHF